VGARGSPCAAPLGTGKNSQWQRRVGTCTVDEMQEQTSQLAMAQQLRQRQPPRSVGVVVQRPVAAAGRLGVVVERPGRLLPGGLGQVLHVVLGRGAVVELQ